MKRLTLNLIGLFVAGLFILSMITLGMNVVNTMASSDDQVWILDSAWTMGKGKGGKPGGGSQPPQQVPWGISRINAQEAAALVDESGVIVAIIDTGLDFSHPDLAGKFLWGWSFYKGNRAVSKECTPSDPSPCKDGNGHGTHVAGTIAALDNSIGVVGVAPDVSLYIFKGLSDRGSGSYSAIAQSIIKATDGPDGVPGTADDADVISMSLGGPSGTAELENAVNYALSYGVVIVAATGNDGASSPSYPAAYPGVIKVGAVDINNNIPWWSNRGETILAPGVDVLSTWTGGGYNTISGTSMATPHVSGVVALAWAAHPNYSNTQIRNLVEGSADQYGVVNALAVV